MEQPVKREEMKRERGATKPSEDNVCSWKC